MGSEEEMDVAKKRKRSNEYAARTRDPDKPLVQAKINQDLLEIDMHILWIAWTKSWGVNTMTRSHLICLAGR